MKGTGEFALYNKRPKRGMRVAVSGHAHLAGVIVKVGRDSSRWFGVRVDVLFPDGKIQSYSRDKLIDFDGFYHKVEKDFLKLDQCKTKMKVLSAQLEREDKTKERVPLRVVYTPGYEPITQVLWGSEIIYEGKSVNPAFLRQKADEWHVPVEEGGQITYDPGPAPVVKKGKRRVG